MSTQNSEEFPAEGTARNVRLPLFEVELAYIEGMDESAASSKTVASDLSELINFHPPENEFHTRLEVRFSESMTAWTR